MAEGGGEREPCAASATPCLGRCRGYPMNEPEHSMPSSTTSSPPMHSPRSAPIWGRPRRCWSATGIIPIRACDARRWPLAAGRARRSSRPAPPAGDPKAEAVPRNRILRADRNPGW